METGVYIEGAKVEQQAVEALGATVAVIFESAARNRIDEGSLRVALEILRGVGGVSGTSITDSQFSG